MVYRYEWDLIECKMWNWRLKFISEYLFSWFSVLWLFFPASFRNDTHLFLIGIHSMPGWAATARHGVTIKWSTERLNHTENLFRKNLQLKGLLILDLKPCSRTRTIEPSDGFLHLREASLDATWEVEHFRLFFIFLVAGLVDLRWESLNFSNAPYTEKGIYLYPKMTSRLGKYPLRVNLRLDTLDYLLFINAFFFKCCLATPWLFAGCYWGNSRNHLMLIIAFGLSIFGPRLTQRGWISTPNWVPSGLWSQWHNPT